MLASCVAILLIAACDPLLVFTVMAQLLWCDADNSSESASPTSVRAEEGSPVIIRLWLLCGSRGSTAASTSSNTTTCGAAVKQGAFLEPSLCTPLFQSRNSSAWSVPLAALDPWLPLVVGIAAAGAERLAGGLYGRPSASFAKLCGAVAVLEANAALPARYMAKRLAFAWVALQLAAR